jgi:DNA-directed RNA polymerase specialized sigma24 family protein
MYGKAFLASISQWLVALEGPMKRKDACPARSTKDVCSEVMAISHGTFQAAQRHVRAVVRGPNREDALQETFKDALEGTRTCPVEVSFANYVVSCARSINSNWNERNKREVPESQLVNSESESRTKYREPSVPPQQLARLEAREMLHQIETLFAMDALASRVMPLLAEGFTGPEIQETLGLSATDYGTVVKRMRRALEKAFPERLRRYKKPKAAPSQSAHHNEAAGGPQSFSQECQQTPIECK